jgi:DNA-binding beta-propeller fold protein YncE
MLPGLEIIDLQKKTFEYFIPNGLGQIKKPLNCALDSDDRLYIADALRRQVIIFDKNGSYLTAIGDGHSGKPTDVLVKQGKIYICDLDGHQIYVYNRDTHALLSTFPEVNKNQPYYLFSPTNIEFYDEKIYVTDTGDARIKVFYTDGEYIESIGSFGKQAGQFVRPKGLALDRQGRLYVVDAAFENIQIFNRQSQILMYFGGKYEQPGDMWLPAGIFIDYDSNEFFKEYLYPGFELKYLIFVTNQYGPDKISVYAFVE